MQTNVDGRQLLSSVLGSAMFLIIFMKRRISNRKPQLNDQAHAVIGVNNYIDLPMDNRYRKNVK